MVKLVTTPPLPARDNPDDPGHFAIQVPIIIKYLRLH